MFKNLCLATGLVFASATAAQACPSSELGVLGTFQPWYDYTIYDQLNGKDPFEKFTHIDLVKPLLTEIDGEKNYMGNKSSVEFEVIRSLKGGSPKGSRFPYVGFRSDYANNTYLNTKNPKSFNFRKQSIEVQYNFSDERTSAVYWNRSHGIPKYHKSVEFLDSFFLLPPRENHQINSLKVRRSGQCGPTHAQHILPHGTFIVFRRGDVSSLVEATYVSELKTSLLEEIIGDIVETGTSPHLEMSLKVFIKGLPSYQVIETTHCNTSKERKAYIANRSQALDNHLNDYQYLRDTKDYGKTDTLFGKYYSDESIPFSKIKTYFESMDDKDFKCEIDQMFLAVKGNLSNPRQTPPLYLDKRELVSWRFMRIEEDKVFADDLRTNIRIIGPKKVPLSEVLSK